MPGDLRLPHSQDAGLRLEWRKDREDEQCSKALLVDELVDELVDYMMLYDILYNILYIVDHGG